MLFQEEITAGAIHLRWASIKNLKKYLILNQTELSKLFHVSPTSIHYWENGEKLPNDRNYDKFINNLFKILSKYFKDKK